MAETDLYAPVKRFLEKQGYTVKGEIDACDVVAVRADEPPVVVELKERLNLALVLQAVDRLRISDAVYLAFRDGKQGSASWRTRRKEVLALLRRLGLGLLTVSARGRVTAELDPGPYRPRRDAPRQRRLLKEFIARVGDPVAGGSAPHKRLTAYRQDALRCARALSGEHEMLVARLRERTGVERAAAILQDNHYGWFERIRRGWYTLSPKGHSELAEWADAVAALE
ncbi:MAG: DUF2161 family putative PD-(D/E)XK-type phosphodiesterase [bacterium]|nr:DUF2161 family putative PD-(D/E)XK-type phosphodiesterase [bacterium]